MNKKRPIITEKKFIEKMKKKFFGYCGMETVADRIIEIIKASIKFGESINRETCKMIIAPKYISSHKQCSACGSYMSMALQNNYCPYCGRKIQEDAEDESIEFIDKELQE